MKDLDGPQRPIPFSPTMQLRWMLSPTPGNAPRLQQLWKCDDTDAASRGHCLAQEWRDIGFVDWNGQFVI